MRPSQFRHPASPGLPCSSNGCSLFTGMVIFLLIVSCQSSQADAAIGRQAVTTDYPAIIGFKAEGPRATVEEDGTNVFQADVLTRIRLFGIKLNRTSVTFTTHLAERGASCNDFSRTEPYVAEIVDHGVATFSVTLPKGYFYICVKTDDQDRSNWYHMGNAPWLCAKPEGRLMPLEMQIALIVLLLALSGLFSGLNLGLMALDQNDLKVIASCGTEDEKRFARAIQPIRKRGNFLLCSLLLGNVLVNSTLTILLDELSSGLIAVAASTISIVIFGEIIPQAICSRHGLAVGAKTIWIPYIFMIATFPLSWPISKILDHILGDEIGNVYDRERLMEYIRITRDYNKLEAEEVNIISGALGLKKKKVGEIMTRLEDVFLLSINAVLDFQTVSEIQRRGYSRIPVYDGERKNIIALFHAKDLAFVDPEDAMPLKTVIDFYGHPLIHTYEDTTLDVVLEDFKQGKSHMAFARQIYDTGEGDPYYEVTGVVTLEDVIEEILQTEIVDETDIISDNRKKQRRKHQFRQDFSDFAKIGEGEQGSKIISPQMALATFQFLCTSIESFSKVHMSETVLRRLLTQKIYYQCKVEETQLDSGAGKYNSLGKTNQRILYLAGKAVDYFIMILEGRVRVTVGKENLVFESGPFSHFGLAALKPPATGEGLGVLSKASSRHSVSSTHLGATDFKERPPSPEALKKSPSGSAKNPQLHEQCPGGAVATFVSDYTVKVMETTLYLKIPRRVYLAAYRATLMERQKDLLSPDGDDSEDTSCRELDSALRGMRANSIQNINRQRSFPVLSNHRESVASVQGAALSKRKRNSDVFQQSLGSARVGHNSGSYSAGPRASAANGLVLYSSNEEARDAGTDETRILFNQSPAHSPTPSLDEIQIQSFRDRDNLPSSPSLSFRDGASPSETAHLV